MADEHDPIVIEYKDVWEAIERAPKEQMSDSELARQRVAQDIGFRRWLFVIIIGMMVLEVAAMFVLVFLQGFGAIDLETWALASIEGGVLLQTFGLTKIVTKALFVEDRASRQAES